ncbi:hypothetical protein [Saccharibacillus qingshengii]|uniref:hypothetical protein n=1 Tax=Saccharibacillus qingshengii TaxID=1763540 RepID=UPI001557DCBC|nr:hypothetical protein [Saccharibacillus qingshengii]
MMMNGCGRSTGKMSNNYIISLPLPDDLSGIEFRVRAYEDPTKKKPPGPEILLR